MDHEGGTETSSDVSSDDSGCGITLMPRVEIHFPGRHDCTRHTCIERIVYESRHTIDDTDIYLDMSCGKDFGVKVVVPIVTFYRREYMDIVDWVSKNITRDTTVLPCEELIPEMSNRIV